MEKIGTLLEYFQGMEMFYDENLITSFEVTEPTRPVITAQLEWLKRETDQWIKRVARDSFFKVESCSFVKNDAKKETFFKARVIALGGIKNTLNFNPITKTGMLNAIKKNLAQLVLKNFPFHTEVGKDKSNFYGMIDYALTYPLIAKETTVSFFCENKIENHFWDKIIEKDFLEGGIIYDLISKFLLSKKARLVCIHNVNLNPLNFYIDFVFNEDVPLTYCQRLMVGELAAFSDYSFGLELALCI